MTKDEAVDIFGGKRKDLCAALQISRKTFYNWEDPLPQDKIDRIRGAYMRVAEEKDSRLIHVVGWHENKKPLDHDDRGA